MRSPDQSAALLAHFKRQRGCWVPLRPIVPGGQHHHLHHRGCHGDAVANGEGDSVVVVGEAGVSVEQDVAGDVAEGEGVAWREGEGVSGGACICRF